MSGLPFKEIVEARHALADKCITLQEKFDRSNIRSWVLRRKIEVKILKLQQSLRVLDVWIEERNNASNNG